MLRAPGGRLVLIALLFFAASALPHAQNPQPAAGAGPQASKGGPSFTLGALRRDGVIIPFASHGNGRWTNAWPAPGQRPEIPITLAASPKSWWLNGRPAGYWTAWPLRGDSRVVFVKNIVSVTAQCQPQLGLQTDYTSIEAPGPARMQPHPKDGLATTGDVVVEPLELLNAQAADWVKVAAEVAARVTDAEGKLLADRRGTLPVTDAERRKKPFTLEVLFRTAGPRAGTTLLYFEGVKRYGAAAGARRGYQTAPEPLTYAVGFVVLDPQAAPRINETVTLSDSRREGLLYTQPLGALRMNGRLYWAVQRSGWGYERFDVLEMAEPDIKAAIETAGGSCR